MTLTYDLSVTHLQLGLILAYFINVYMLWWCRTNGCLHHCFSLFLCVLSKAFEMFDLDTMGTFLREL